MAVFGALDVASATLSDVTNLKCLETQLCRGGSSTVARPQPTVSESKNFFGSLYQM